MLRWISLLLLSSALFAQRPSPGLKFGVPISEVCAAESFGARGSANFCTDRYVIGPSIDLPLVAGFSADVAALFARANFQASTRGVPGFPFSSTRQTGSIWDFPLLAKYRILRGRIAPYAVAGPSFRRISLEGQLTVLTTPAGEPAVSTVSVNRWQTGWALGAGIEFRAGSVRLSPEIRHSRWPSEFPCRECGGDFRFSINPTVLMLGIAF